MDCGESSGRLAFKANHSHDATVLVEGALIAFWVTAIAVVVLRRQSRGFASVTAYGGRHVLEGVPAAVAPQAAVKSLFSSTLFAHMSRRKSFQCFYIAGVTSAGAVSALLVAVCEPAAAPALWLSWWWTKLAAAPSLLFGAHCVVRWIESTYRQQYRADDTVTVFAMLSGSGFYVAAMLSTASWTPGTTVTEGYTYSAVLLLALVHLMVQMVQVHHHELLRGLRRPAGVAVGCVPPSKQRSYVFPNGQALFSLVQEPHYLCEVMLYFVQWAMLVNMRGGQQLPALLVCVFTLGNLAVTADDHRRYWQSAKARGVPKYLIVPGLL